MKRKRIKKEKKKINIGHINKIETLNPLIKPKSIQFIRFGWGFNIIEDYTIVSLVRALCVWYLIGGFIGLTEVLGWLVLGFIGHFSFKICHPTNYYGRSKQYAYIEFLNDDYFAVMENSYLYFLNFNKRKSCKMLFSVLNTQYPIRTQLMTFKIFPKENFSI